MEIYANFAYQLLLIMKRISIFTTLILCLTVACQKNEVVRERGEIKFPAYEKTTVDFLDTIPVIVPENFSKSDYAAFLVTIESELGSSTSVTTKSSADSKAWEVETLAPVFDASGKMTRNPGIIIKRIPMDGSNAVLTASLVDSNGERMNTSLAVCSASYSNLEEKIEEIFTSEIENWDEGKVIEMICWYMCFLYDAEGQDEFSDEILEFVNSHKRLFLASKYTDLQDKEIASAVNYEKELIEDQEDDETLETEPGGNNNGALYADGRTLLCHTTLPCASHTLASNLNIAEDYRFLPVIAQNIIRRLCTFQNTDVKTMFQAGVRVFDYQLIGNYGASFLCDGGNFSKSIEDLASMVSRSDQFAIVIVSVSMMQTIKDLINIISGNPQKGPDYYDRLDHLHKMLAEIMAKPEYKDLFVPFRADMTVDDARGHIILMWGDEWEDDTEVTPFGAVINKPDEGIKGSIQTWNSDTEEWEDAAELMYNDIGFLEYCDSKSDRKVAGRRVAEKIGDFDRIYRPAVMKTQPVPIWCIQRADCAMKFKMPPIPKLIIKIKTGVSIPYYPNAAEATEFINPSVADYFFRPDKYFMNQRGPSGIIFLHMVATDECRVPLFGGKHKCYGISVVDRVVTHQPLMPYIPSQPRD